MWLFHFTYVDQKKKYNRPDWFIRRKSQKQFFDVDHIDGSDKNNDISGSQMHYCQEAYRFININYKKIVRHVITKRLIQK